MHQLLWNVCTEVRASECGGLATYFDLDPTLVRLIFVLLTLATGIGLIIYIVMAIITPQDPFVTI